MEHDAATYADALPPARQNTQTDHAKIAPVMQVLRRRQEQDSTNTLFDGAWLSYIARRPWMILYLVSSRAAPREGNRAVGATSRD